MYMLMLDVCCITSKYTAEQRVMAIRWVISHEPHPWVFMVMVTAIVIGKDFARHLRH